MANRRAHYWYFLPAILLTASVPAAHATPVFNGAPENQRDDLGYYYVITASKFINAQTRNGTGASGGVMRYTNDEPAWNQPQGFQQWAKDGWFAQTAGLAMTLRLNATSVYDNNGIDDGTHGTFYDAQASGTASAATPGLYRGYSMSNNYDWIYAGYFKVDQDTTFDTIIGYFDENAGFDRTSPDVGYNVNIWSSVNNGDLPLNTNGFLGDLFNSDSFPGQFFVEDTGVDRVFDDGSTDDIFRLSYRLATPFTLPAGEYYFSHDAEIGGLNRAIALPMPEPASLTLLSLAAALLAQRRGRLNRPR